MKYLNARLSTKQKKKLMLLISTTDKKIISLHDWILGRGESDLCYVKPKDRLMFDDCGRTLTNFSPITVIDMWELLEIIGRDIPVDGVELIKYLNEIGINLDLIHKDEK